MPTETDIANQALSRLGEPRISSIDANTVNAIAIRLHFETVRDSLLRSHRWNFATGRAELVQLTDAPVFGWSYQYQLPTDFLRLATLNGIEAKMAEAYHTIEGDKLLTDREEAKITYIKRVEDPNSFDSLFTEVLILKLAAAVALDITSSSSKRDEMLSEAARMMEGAGFVDAVETRPKTLSPISGSAGIQSRNAFGLIGGATAGSVHGPPIDELKAKAGDDGENGWTPSIAVVEDGDRRVIQITGWTGGTKDEPESGFLGSSGIVATAATAINIRGAIGLTGDAGDDGWAPVLAIVPDGDRFVLQVIDWTGGEGTKPATGDYIGASGLTAVIAEATNVRGPAGLGSGDVIGPAGAIDSQLASFDGTTGKLIQDSGLATADVSGAISDATAAKTKTDLLTVTGAIDLDTIASDVATNNAKVTNADHTGDVTGATALTISNDAVTFAKMQNITTQRVIGRNTAGNGDPEEVQLSTLLDWVSGSVANGDILVRSAGTWNRLGVGSNDQVLSVVSGAPAWADASGGGAFTQAVHSIYTSTGAQTLTDTHSDIDGSSISITPTASGRTIIYTLAFHAQATGAAELVAHFKFIAEGSEVVAFRKTVRAHAFGEAPQLFMASYTSVGTSPVTLKVQARRYSASFPGALHQVRAWDGATSAQNTNAIVSAVELLP